jgi:cobaltochelatase CobS
MTMTMTQRLADALAISDFTQRRIELRKICQSALERTSLDTYDIASAFKRSPIVGQGVGKIAPRPTISGLRDALDEETQVALIMGEITYHDVLSAVSDPVRFGVKATSSRAKTEYVFGRPSSLQPNVAADIMRRAKSSPTPKETTMAFHLGLQECINIIDVLTHEHHMSMDEALSACVLANQEFPRDAVASALRLRGEVNAPAALSNDAATFITSVDTGSSSEPAKPTTYEKPDAGKAQVIDLMLAQAGLPAIGTLVDELNQASERIREAEARASVAAVPTATVKANGPIPNGRVKTAKAYDVFGLTRGRETFNFDVPVWMWDADHPHVPDVDADYVFRPFELLRVLYALITNQRAYLHGHTGSGKTTLIEQVAARLCWPFMRVNFDSEITRMDLIGRDVLTNDGGVTASKFVDGILPQMMSGPYIGCFDELDFVRPDVAYVMQRAFEGNGLLLTEDGGRMIRPHSMFRAFATGNTVGQGDEFGMYQGARPQSMALLDRFTVWIHVDYMSSKDRLTLIKARCPALGDELTNKLNQYVGEHLEAFKGSKVLQPISPRGYLALGNALATFTAYFPMSSRASAIEQAIQTTILDRATSQDRAVLKGIADRVFA